MQDFVHQPYYCTRSRKKSVGCPTLSLPSPSHTDNLPRPSIYPLLDPKCPLFGTTYPYLRVQGGSRYCFFSRGQKVGASISSCP